MSLLNPIGTKDVMCKLDGHKWKTLFVEDREFRHCLRCDRQERKEYLGFGFNMWSVNEVKPTIA
jgi:hypothetical protein